MGKLHRRSEKGKIGVVGVVRCCVSMRGRELAAAPPTNEYLTLVLKSALGKHPVGPESAGPNAVMREPLEPPLIFSLLPPPLLLLFFLFLFIFDSLAPLAPPALLHPIATRLAQFLLFYTVYHQTTPSVASGSVRILPDPLNFAHEIDLSSYTQLQLQLPFHPSQCVPPSLSAVLLAPL